MPLKRTPPQNAAQPDFGNAILLSRAKSDLDISGPTETPSPVSNRDFSLITVRSKRPRSEVSPPSTTMEEFKTEMRNMMKSLISEQSAMLCRLSEDVSAIKIQNENIQKSNKEIEDSIDSIKNSCVELSSRINKFEKDRSDCQNGLLNLEKKVESLELTSRTSTLEIRNIPATDNETTSDLMNIVRATAKALKLEIQQSQIRDVYRLPSKPGKTRPIIAEFSTVALKMEVLNSVRNYNKNRASTEKLSTEMIGLKGKSSPIYLSEYLPGPTRKLFYQAREFAKLSDYKFCWAVNGKIYLRKTENSNAIKVDSEQVLRALTNDK
ncbi:uncharacterized protein LOC113237639 [Hyposmocoma kahamanoa]|uniref:uncharacterized protein LOC113237639 n=1 Tax=Hyposmocoma kahamanoa TaxID=1477025 RepID=UPI000E6D6634|nr:uncharacterized protein LOC113237639 [Hyposmocoma kahamanoa]